MEKSLDMSVCVCKCVNMCMCIYVCERVGVYRRPVEASLRPNWRVSVVDRSADSGVRTSTSKSHSLPQFSDVGSGNKKWCSCPRAAVKSK